MKDSVQKNQNFFQRLFATPKQPEAPLRLIVEEPVGSSGTEIYSGYYREEYFEKLTHTEAADEFDKMRRGDSDVKMVLKAVKGPILRANWETEAASEDPVHEAHRELIDFVIFQDTEPGWRQLLGEMLTFVDFGHAVFERTHKIVKNHPKFKTYVGLKKLGWRSPRTIERWNLDRNGKLISVTQFANGDLSRNVDIPGEWLTVISLDKEGDNYEGVSGLRACYGPWWRKQLYLRYMAQGTEKHAVPPPVMKVPTAKQGTEQESNAKNLLKKYMSGQQNYLMIPEGWDLDFMKNPFDPEKVKTCINFENTEVIRAFLANFLDLGSQAGATGSYSLSFDQSDFFLGSLEHMADLVCEAFNKQIIPELIELNFGKQAAYPQLKFSGISDKAGKELAEVLKSLGDGKWIEPDLETEVHLRRRYGLPKKGTEDIRKQDSEKKLPPGKATKTSQLSDASRQRYLRMFADDKKLKFVATGSNQCVECSSLNGKVFEKNDPDLPVIPLHPNCECDLVEED